MKKFWLIFALVVLAIVVVVALVSYIMGEVHDLTWLEELQDWWEAIKGLFVKSSNNTANIRLIA